MGGGGELTCGRKTPHEGKARMRRRPRVDEKLKPDEKLTRKRQPDERLTKQPRQSNGSRSTACTFQVATGRATVRPLRQQSRAAIMQKPAPVQVCCGSLSGNRRGCRGSPTSTEAAGLLKQVTALREKARATMEQQQKAEAAEKARKQAAQRRESRAKVRLMLAEPHQRGEPAGEDCPLEALVKEFPGTRAAAEAAKLLAAETKPAKGK